MRQIDHHLATGVAAGETTRTHKVWNPSTGEVQAEVALGDAALLDFAEAGGVAAGGGRLAVRGGRGEAHRHSSCMAAVSSNGSLDLS